MRNLKLEKSIKKIDRDMEALKIAKKYLSNHDEIEQIRKELNEERQTLATELYSEDDGNHVEAMVVLAELIGKKLNADEQKELLADIKDIYGRNLPNPSKESSGLNAWLKFIDVDCTWIEDPKTGWAELVINKIN